MANRRDLHVGIDADDRGFGAAFEDAQDKARDLDKELGKLERQQALTEKSTNRAADAARKFGVEQEKAGLQARKMGAQVQQASDRAEKAQKRADAAAKAYERGLIDEATAARAAANAAKAVEQANIRAAEAQLAAREAAERVARAQRDAARAAEEQAQQERQLARDAALAAAAQRLAQLKAAGAVKEHNALLGHLQATYGDLSKEASGAFKAIESSGNTAYRTLTSASAQLGETGPLAIVGIANAIVALPTLATAAGAALTLGVGGALAAIGIKAQLGAKDVKAAFSDLQKYVTKQLTSISAPFHDTLLHMAADGRRAFDSLTPALENAFAQMAPAVTRFAGYFADSLKSLDPLIRSIGRAFVSVLDTIGPRLPTVLNNVSTGFKAIFDAVQKNPKALADLVVDISNFVRYSGDAIGFLIRFKNEFNGFFDVLAGGGPLGFLHFVDGIGTLTSAIGGFVGIGGKGSQTAHEIGAAAEFASPQTAALAKDMQTLSSTTATATEKANALSDAFERLLNPAEAVFTDTAKLKEGIGELSKALEKSHGRLNDNSAAGRAAKQAFTGVLDSAKALASDMITSGQSIDDVRSKLNPYIHSLYEAAGGNKQAKALVDAFVRSLGLVPPKKGTTLTLNDREFLSKLHAAQGLKLDPKTGYLLGNNSDYFNKWLKANGLKIDPKTGLFKGNNADYYNKWLKANGLHIDTKTGKITGNTSAFWAAVHAIPQTVGYRKIGVYYVPLNSANEPGHTRHADGGIDRYANGGLRRDLDPMVVDRPTVLFGETSTGGEAYIPLGLNKRGRSTELLRQVAREFGLDVVKRIPVQAAPVLSGSSGGSSQPAQVNQTFVASDLDVHQLARESAREIAWTLRG